MPITDTAKYTDHPKGASKCPISDVRASTYQVMRASELLASGTINIDDIDGWYLEMVEHCRAERSRVEYQHMEEQRRGQTA